MRQEPLRTAWTDSDTPEELINNVCTMGSTFTNLTLQLYEFWHGKGYQGLLLAQLSTILCVSLFCA